MSDPENPISSPQTQTPSSDTQTISEIRSAVESLRGVFQVVALSGIVLSATLLLFLYKEVSVARRQNLELMGYINDHNTNLIPRIEIARTNLEAFAKTNPSIAPIIKKYFSTNPPPATPPPPAPTP